MPSPFPGMDPYLEDPEFFPGLRDSFIIYLCEFLQPRLPESYYAHSNSRVWVEYTGRAVTPDGNRLPTCRPTAVRPANGDSEGAVVIRTLPTSRSRAPSAGALSVASWSRIWRSSCCSCGPGSIPSSSASRRREARYVSRAAACRPERYSASISW